MQWVSAIDPSFVERRFGPDAVNAALARAWLYATPPGLDRASSRLAAAIVEAHDGRLAAPMRVAVRVHDDGLIDFGCACGSRHICSHAALLLVDVAFHPTLRTALIAERPTDDLAQELPGVRASALEERTLDERLASWLPPRGFDADMLVDVDVATMGDPSERRAAVFVRHRRPKASRGGLVAAKDVLASRLAPKHRRLVELTAPYHLDRDVLVATRGQASLLIHLLREEIGVFAGGFEDHLRFARPPVSPRVEVEPVREADGRKREVEDGRLVARWYDADGRVVGAASETVLFTGPFPYLWTPRSFTFHPVADTVDLDAALGMQRVPTLPLLPANARRIGRELLVRGRGLGVAFPSAEVFGLPPLEKPSFELRLSGSPLDVRADLFAVYEAGKFPVGSSSSGPVDGRDLDAEDGALLAVCDAGFVASEGVLLASEDRAVALWESGLSSLRASDHPRFEVIVAETIANTTIVRAPITIDVHVRERVGWLDAELEFRAGALRVEMDRLHAALAANHGWVALSDGSLVKIAAQVAALVGEAKAMHFENGRLPPHQIGRLERWRLAKEVTLHVAEEAQRILDRVHCTDTRALAGQARVPAGLEQTLRPYQRVGLCWLQRLAELGAGGLLADDMGLGKTLMTLAFLASEHKRGASLIVCPTSVVGNWLREAERFTPRLKAAAWTSSERKLECFDENDIVVTTYGLVRREIERLATIPFSAVVLDEAQNIKNPRAETSRAAFRLDARMRIALTGTPIENRLSELWSLMTFVNPGILGTATEFFERFEQPFAAAAGSHLSAGVRAPRPGDDEPVSHELRTIVRPFILRRTKGEVLSDLPPKTDVERVCIFGLRQKRLYDALALSLRETVSRVDARRGNARTHLSILTAILRLRQMACDPRLVDPDALASDSAKRVAFLDVVRELVSENRRALVFSQFVELLRLWRIDLDEAKVAYEYLDGSTTNRDAVVERFRTGSAPLFLVSLKAGGAGLNLTAADTVIHCDPWWNPATEDQATDRAHRMGQTRPVTVVRLVAAGTIEDKIALLKKRKRELVDAILDEGEGIGLLTEEDVRTLLGDAETATDDDA